MKINGKKVSLVTEYVGFTKKDNWDCNEWKVTVKYNNKQFTTSYYTGVAIGEPTVEMVVEALLLDATAYNNARDFEDFATEFGYDTDSRKAEKIYKECGRIAKRMDKMFPDIHEALEQLQEV